ncbi:unnamed protein product [Clonostachys chloroleuca]|uniref:Aldehyde dehydrogenase domain-containing protein n=1 Tax=Clonostachys chloroleuca TaxID=1926264 RepID=A0AA35QBF3_9HYPO|nr:unnamed protein product [Clonostachys chloroleuca]
MKNAVKWAHYDIMGNMGQICTTTSRIFIHERIYDEFIELFLKCTAKISIVGDPFDEKTWHGPQVSKAQRVPRFWLVASKAYFIDPTVVGDVNPSMKVYQEEIFGPFAVVVKFTSEEEVIKAANDTEYGLAATLFTTGVTRVVRVSQQLRDGNIWINSKNNSDFRVPLARMKQSGIGRELGEAVL